MSYDPKGATGTTGAIHVAPAAGVRPIDPGRDYFFVQVRGAQAVATGSIWDNVKRLVVTSEVRLNAPQLGGSSVLALQRSREVRKNAAEQLGLQTNLIGLVPSVMTHVSISVDFILDRENRLRVLAEAIEGGDLLVPLSLAPGAVAAAKAVGRLSQVILRTFVPEDERRPILQFSGDFNLAASDLREGHYVVLGSRDERNPIPQPLPELDVRDGVVVAGGLPVSNLSYVVFYVGRVEARTRDQNDGAPWDTKLREAEDHARLANGPFTTEDELRSAWNACRGLMKEGQALLRADPNYLREEADAIVKGVYVRCDELLFGGAEKERGRGAGLRTAWKPEFAADRAFLDILPDEDLDATLDRYADQVGRSRRVLASAGL